MVEINQKKSFSSERVLHPILFHLVFAILFLAIIILIPNFSCEKPETDRSKPNKQPVKVSVVTVKPQNIPFTIKYLAQVKSSRQVSIQARVSGFLEKRVYTEGSLVHEGDVLFMMDQKPFQVQLDQAEASLSKQQASFDVARLNLARVKPLAQANALSQKDLDDATGKYLYSAAAVEQARAAVEEAKLNLSYTVITTPVTGLASYAEQAEGTFLNSSNSLLTTVTVTSPVYIEFSVSENDWLRYLDQVKKGNVIGPKNNQFLVDVVLADGSTYPQTGKISFADPSFNPQTGTFLLRATLDNPDGLLRPNQFVRAHLRGAILPKAVLVPQRAVQQSPRGHFVWVVNKGKAERRPVVVGEFYKSDWIIFEGLHEGDQVVVEGLMTLQPGAAVKAAPLVDQMESQDQPAAGKDSSPNSQ